jgi:hypothetical protein
MEAKTHDVALLTTATVLSPLFLLLYPITASLMGEVTAPSHRSSTWSRADQTWDLRESRRDRLARLLGVVSSAGSGDAFIVRVRWAAPAWVLAQAR